MNWLLPASQYERQKGIKNKNAMKKLLKEGNLPGIIAYLDKQPIGWCAIAPREKYIRLEKSRTLIRIDDQPVWSVSCFFISKEFRRKGISLIILKQAIKFAVKNGATIIEGYPFLPKKPQLPDPFVWTGMLKTYQQAGFKEIARFSKVRPIMRYIKK